MYPIVVFLLDGLADRAHEVLGGRTGNEAASTPNLDALAAGGSCGLLYAVGPGRAPSSEVAHWSMLGYRPDEFPGRAVFEALGRGQEVSAERCARLRRSAAGRTARRRVVADRAARPGSGRRRGRAPRRALQRDRRGRADVLARPRLARRGRPAHLGRRRRARHGHRRVLPRPAPPVAPAAARAGGGAHRPRLRGVDAGGAGPPRERAVQRDHAQVVRPAATGAELPRAPRRDRRVRGGLRVPAGARAGARARAARRAGDRRSGRRPAQPRGAGQASGSTRATPSSSAIRRRPTRRGTRRTRVSSRRRSSSSMRRSTTCPPTGRSSA